MSETVLALLMLAGLALSAGSWFVFRRGDRKRALLMLVAALTMFANVVIWLAPVPGSGTP